MNLLHIDSSALGAHSVSRELGAAIVTAWKRAHPGAIVTYRDVAAQPLPHWAPVADAERPDRARRRCRSSTNSSPRTSS